MCEFICTFDMDTSDYQNLSKRERQIMDVVHRLNEASVNDVIERLPNPSGYNSIRMLMNILEKKGHLDHRVDKKRFIYFPTVQKEVVKKSALDHMLATYFDKSVPSVVSALLSEKDLTHAELDELSEMISQAKKNVGDGE